MDVFNAITINIIEKIKKIKEKRVKRKVKVGIK